MAVLLEALALGEVGDDVAGHEDSDADVGPQLSPQGLVEPYHGTFACLQNYIYKNQNLSLESMILAKEFHYDLVYFTLKTKIFLRFSITSNLVVHV